VAANAAGTGWMDCVQQLRRTSAGSCNLDCAQVRDQAAVESAKHNG
jgi:hypothetical protein